MQSLVLDEENTKLIYKYKNNYKGIPVWVYTKI